jgi:streptomycin 6-kinase
VVERYEFTEHGKICHQDAISSSAQGWLAPQPKRTRG